MSKSLKELQLTEFQAQLPLCAHTSSFEDVERAIVYLVTSYLKGLCPTAPLPPGIYHRGLSAVKLALAVGVKRRAGSQVKAAEALAISRTTLALNLKQARGQTASPT